MRTRLISSLKQNNTFSPRRALRKIDANVEKMETLMSHTASITTVPITRILITYNITSTAVITTGMRILSCKR